PEWTFLPILWFVPKLSALTPVDKPCMDAWQGCRFAASRPRLALLVAASAPIVRVQIAREAATGRGEASDGSGAAAQADVDRRQRSPPLSGRHLAAVACATAPRRSRALLRGLTVRALLVGDALRRHLRGRARS